MTSAILVTGGAGYVGSHMVKMLGDAGYNVIAYDNLSSGHREAVLRGTFVEGDLADTAKLDTVLASGVDAVMHFAASIQVGESVAKPQMYYRNNVLNTLNLLEAMAARGIRRLIFSSTAALFGEPQYVPIDELHPERPLNPYGMSKWMVERMLPDFERAHDLRSISLRYFNAAGADPTGLLGERHEPETHLIPLLMQVAAGRRPHIEVYGRDYPTPDGTCVRDYVHVEDLCAAHLSALERLQGGARSAAYNLGNGNGFSVQTIVEAARRVTGRPIRVVDSARRPGDPARLVADSSRAKIELPWNPRYADIDSIIAHAWRWETRQAGNK
jgi:UDP-glucose 4-epimerase